VPGLGAARYTPEFAAEVWDGSPEDLVRLAELLCESSGRERTTIVVYPLRWTQHTTGVQTIRTAGILQSLLGNFRGSSLCLEVRDDGRGLSSVEVDEARKRGHFGLGGMRDRAIHLGGYCAMRPRPGGGTIVTLELPLDRVRT
jgi:glucose-6-phosphate-specific signal transduction histidine kinase